MNLQRDVFFSFSEADTNILPYNNDRLSRFYKNMKSKFSGAKYVGDKIPNLENMIEVLYSAFPDARFIYMVRNIDSVASSWNARAQNPRDRWPEENDYKKAVQAWNATNRRVLELLKEIPEICIVNYEKFFSKSNLTDIINFLEVKETEYFIRSYEKSCVHYINVISKKEPLIMPDQASYIYENADYDAYRKIIEKAI